MTIDREIEKFLNDDIARKYIQEMRVPRKLWGGDLEVAAISELLNLQIVIHKNGRLMHPIGRRKSNIIHIAYSGVHYDVCDKNGKITWHAAADNDCLFHSCIQAALLNGFPISPIRGVVGNEDKYNLARKNAAEQLRREVCNYLEDEPQRLRREAEELLDITNPDHYRLENPDDPQERRGFIERFVNDEDRHRIKSRFKMLIMQSFDEASRQGEHTLDLPSGAEIVKEAKRLRDIKRGSYRVINTQQKVHASRPVGGGMAPPPGGMPPPPPGGMPPLGAINTSSQLVEYDLCLMSDLPVEASMDYTFCLMSDLSAEGGIKKPEIDKVYFEKIANNKLKYIVHSPNTEEIFEGEMEVGEIGDLSKFLNSKKAYILNVISGRGHTSSIPKPKINKIYLEKTQGSKLKYIVLSPNGAIVEDVMEGFDIKGDLTKEILNKKRLDILEITSKKGHTRLSLPKKVILEKQLLDKKISRKSKKFLQDQREFLLKLLEDNDSNASAVLTILKAFYSNLYDDCAFGRQIEICSLMALDEQYNSSHGVLLKQKELIDIGKGSSEYQNDYSTTKKGLYDKKKKELFGYISSNEGKLSVDDAGVSLNIANVTEGLKTLLEYMRVGNLDDLAKTLYKLEEFDLKLCGSSLVDISDDSKVSQKVVEDTLKFISSSTDKGSVDSKQKMQITESIFEYFLTVFPEQTDFSKLRNPTDLLKLIVACYNSVRVEHQVLNLAEQKRQFLLFFPKAIEKFYEEKTQKNATKIKKFIEDSLSAEDPRSIKKILLTKTVTLEVLRELIQGQNIPSSILEQSKEVKLGASLAIRKQTKLSKEQLDRIISKWDELSDLSHQAIIGMILGLQLRYEQVELKSISKQQWIDMFQSREVVSYFDKIFEALTSSNSEKIQGVFFSCNSLKTVIAKIYNNHKSDLIDSSFDTNKMGDLNNFAKMCYYLCKQKNALSIQQLKEEFKKVFFEEYDKLSAKERGVVFRDILDSNETGTLNATLMVNFVKDLFDEQPKNIEKCKFSMIQGDKEIMKILAASENGDDVVTEQETQRSLSADEVERLNKDQLIKIILYLHQEDKILGNQQATEKLIEIVSNNLSSFSEQMKLNITDKEIEQFIDSDPVLSKAIETLSEHLVANKTVFSRGLPIHMLLDKQYGLLQDKSHPEIKQIYQTLKSSNSLTLDESEFIKHATKINGISFSEDELRQMVVACQEKINDHKSSFLMQAVKLKRKDPSFVSAPKEFINQLRESIMNKLQTEIALLEGEKLAIEGLDDQHKKQVVSVGSSKKKLFESLNKSAVLAEEKRAKIDNLKQKIDDLQQHANEVKKLFEQDVNNGYVNLIADIFRIIDGTLDLNLFANMSAIESAVKDSLKSGVPGKKSDNSNIPKSRFLEKLTDTIQQIGSSSDCRKGLKEEWVGLYARMFFGEQCKIEFSGKDGKDIAVTNYDVRHLSKCLNSKEYSRLLGSLKTFKTADMLDEQTFKAFFDDGIVTKDKISEFLYQIMFTLGANKVREFIENLEKEIFACNLVDKFFNNEQELNNLDVALDLLSAQEFKQFLLFLNSQEGFSTTDDKILISECLKRYIDEDGLDKEDAWYIDNVDNINKVIKKIAQSFIDKNEMPVNLGNKIFISRDGNPVIRQLIRLADDENDLDAKIKASTNIKDADEGIAVVHITTTDLPANEESRDSLLQREKLTSWFQETYGNLFYKDALLKYFNNLELAGALGLMTDTQIDKLKSTNQKSYDVIKKAKECIKNGKGNWLEFENFLREGENLNLISEGIVSYANAEIIDKYDTFIKAMKEAVKKFDGDFAQQQEYVKSILADENLYCSLVGKNVKSDFISQFNIPETLHNRDTISELWIRHIKEIFKEKFLSVEQQSQMFNAENSDKFQDTHAKFIKQLTAVKGAIDPISREFENKLLELDGDVERVVNISTQHASARGLLISTVNGRLEYLKKAIEQALKGEDVVLGDDSKDTLTQLVEIIDKKIAEDAEIITYNNQIVAHIYEELDLYQRFISDAKKELHNNLNKSADKFMKNFENSFVDQQRIYLSDCMPIFNTVVEKLNAELASFKVKINKIEEVVLNGIHGFETNKTACFTESIKIFENILGEENARKLLESKELEQGLGNVQVLGLQADLRVQQEQQLKLKQQLKAEQDQMLKDRATLKGDMDKLAMESIDIEEGLNRGRIVLAEEQERAHEYKTLMTFKLDQQKEETESVSKRGLGDALFNIDINQWFEELQKNPKAFGDKMITEEEFAIKVQNIIPDKGPGLVLIAKSLRIRADKNEVVKIYQQRYKLILDEFSNQHDGEERSNDRKYSSGL